MEIKMNTEDATKFWESIPGHTDHKSEDLQAMTPAQQH